MANSRIKKSDKNVLEDARLNTVGLVRKYGFPCEKHHVTTEDGYILEMHRIPHGRAPDVGKVRPVVMLQHGLLSSSAEWVIMMPGKGLAYILAEAGYDVWMGNARGNTYSRKHTTKKTTYPSFWRFTWHEIGYYDLPAMIDHIVNETKVEKIHYVAFSQGTTVFWVMTSMRPEYNDRILSMQAMAPIAYVGNVRSPLVNAVASLANEIEAILKIFGTNEMLPNSKLNDLAGQKFCVDEAITQVLCTNLLFLICGFDESQLNTSMVPVIMGHTPAGASFRQFVHYGQLYRSHKFQQFDYGLLGNTISYGTFFPPSYNLSAIRAPVYLHYADNDWVSSTKDVERLAKELKTLKGKYKVPMMKFSHLDFVFGIDAKKFIYDRLMNIMQKYNN